MMDQSVLSLFESAIIKDVSISLEKWGSFPPFSIIVEGHKNGYMSKVVNYNRDLDIILQCKALKNHLITSKEYLKLDLILTCTIANVKVFEEDERHLEDIDSSVFSYEPCICIVSDSFCLQSIITIPIVNNKLDLSRRTHEALVSSFLVSETLSPIIYSN